MREWIGSLALRAYPRSVRQARGPEMLSMLLDAGQSSSFEFTRECGSLVMGGLRERAQSRGQRLLAASALIIAALAVGAITLGFASPGHARNQSDIARLAAALMMRLHPGDLVLVTEPSQTSLAHKYLPDDVRYATPLGLDSHPGVAYQHVYSRLLSADSGSNIERLLTTLHAGQHVLVIRSLLANVRAWRSPETVTTRRRAAQVAELLAHDPKLRVVTSAPRKYGGQCCLSDAALLYVQS